MKATGTDAPFPRSSDTDRQPGLSVDHEVGQNQTQRFSFLLPGFSRFLPRPYGHCLNAIAGNDLVHQFSHKWIIFDQENSAVHVARIIGAKYTPLERLKISRREVSRYSLLFPPSVVSIRQTDLNSLIPENIRLITFDENTIKVLLKGNREIVFQFRTRDAMAKALEAWATKRDVADALASQATLQLPSDSKRGQIYP